MKSCSRGDCAVAATLRHRKRPSAPWQIAQMKSRWSPSGPTTRNLPKPSAPESMANDVGLLWVDPLSWQVAVHGKRGGADQTEGNSDLLEHGRDVRGETRRHRFLRRSRLASILRSASVRSMRCAAMRISSCRSPSSSALANRSAGENRRSSSTRIVRTRRAMFDCIRLLCPFRIADFGFVSRGSVRASEKKVRETRLARE